MFALTYYSNASEEITQKLDLMDGKCYPFVHNIYVNEMNNRRYHYNFSGEIVFAINYKNLK